MCRIFLRPGLHRYLYVIVLCLIIPLTLGFQECGRPARVGLIKISNLQDINKFKRTVETDAKKIKTKFAGQPSVLSEAQEAYQELFVSMNNWVETVAIAVERNEMPRRENPEYMKLSDAFARAAIKFDNYVNRRLRGNNRGSVSDPNDYVEVALNGGINIWEQYRILAQQERVTAAAQIRTQGKLLQWNSLS
jgi:hypothetical protein